MDLSKERIKRILKLDTDDLEKLRDEIEDELAERSEESEKEESD